MSMVEARSRSTKGPYRPKRPENPIRRAQRQVLRAFTALGSPLSTSQLMEWVYPRVKSPDSWHYRVTRTAALRWAQRIGRSDKGSGTPIMWLPKDKIGDHEPE